MAAAGEVRVTYHMENAMNSAQLDRESNERQVTQLVNKGYVPYHKTEADGSGYNTWVQVNRADRSLGKYDWLALVAVGLLVAALAKAR
jgi:hypothetical protein